MESALEYQRLLETKILQALSSRRVDLNDPHLFLPIFEQRVHAMLAHLQA